jgi:hypothetical protein
MKINFIYDLEKDIECLLNKGAGSINSPNKPTKTYQKMINSNVDLGNKITVRNFVQNFLLENNINTEENSLLMKSNWKEVENKFIEIAERVFGVNLTGDYNAYLTIAGRYPYSINKKYFYVSAFKNNVNQTVMHELWHFFTYAKFGTQIEEIGSKRFNDMKEALTVLLNIECADLMGGAIDKGYEQHILLREKISFMWNNQKNIEQIWSTLVSE